MVVGQEIEGLGTAVAAGGYGRLDGADIISKMGRSGGGDSGQDTLFFRHEINSFLAIESSHSGLNRPNESAWRSVARLSGRSEEHTSELQSRGQIVCRLLLVQETKSYRRD